MAVLDNRADAPCLSLRSSQIKIRFPADIELDPSHLTIDVLRVSRLGNPGRLSPELTINLAHNEVPASVFARIQEDAVRASVEPLLMWEDNVRLWYVVEHAKHVVSGRRNRQVIAESRLHGRYSDASAEIIEGDRLETSRTQSVAWWPDPFSGCPSSTAEIVIGLIEAGFLPQDLSMLRELLWYLIKEVIRRDTKKMNFKIPLSANGFVVPGMSCIALHTRCLAHSSSIQILTASWVPMKSN
jgi:RNA-dependent RNA polymerase